MSEKINFKGLNEIRAIAALLVFFHHIELYKSREGIVSLYDSHLLRHFISHIGHFSVICFFILSGFLITYLMLVEKEQTGTIKISDFYMRRVLRIWPLYFLTVGIGFFFLPLLSRIFIFDDQIWYPGLIIGLDYSSLPYFLFMFSNFALVYFRPVAGSAHTWSVSLEEQFYLIWPWVMKYIPLSKYLIWVLIFLFILKIVAGMLVARFLPPNSFPSIFVRTFSIQFMFAGAILASLLYWGFFNRHAKKVIGSRWFTWAWIFSTFLACARIQSDIIISFFFAGLIITFILGEVKIKILHQLGNISFGIYMIHPVCIFISYEIASMEIFQPFFNLALYLLSFSGTLILSELSHRHFEKPFLILKNKFTIVRSG